MATNPAAVVIPAGAIFYYAPTGTTAPTDLSTAWSATWLDLGLLAEDAGDFSFDAESNDYYGRGPTGLQLVRTFSQKQKVVIPVDCLEDNKAVWALANPGSTASSTTGITTRIYKTPVPQTVAIGIEVVDGSTVKRRFVIKSADVKKRSQPQIYSSDPGVTGLDVTPYTDSTSEWMREITNLAAAVVP